MSLDGRPIDWPPFIPLFAIVIPVVTITDLGEVLKAEVGLVFLSPFSTASGKP